MFCFILHIFKIQIPSKYIFQKPTETIFGALFWLPNRYRISRGSFLATRQMSIFQEAFFGYQLTDNIEAISRTISLRTDISSIFLAGCFRFFVFLGFSNLLIGIKYLFIEILLAAPTDYGFFLINTKLNRGRNQLCCGAR